MQPATLERAVSTESRKLTAYAQTICSQTTCANPPRESVWDSGRNRLTVRLT